MYRKSDISIDSCGAAAIIYMPDGRKLSNRQCAERMLHLEKVLAAKQDEIDALVAEISLRKKTRGG